ncbi:copper amine oxidase N-terminal domain-containing protein [Paenibacillus nanensis]|uniref:Copper amine oxidase N-terminal domain-containing protein n=1 Tax=Paenibacillus nanensis TaxID=393251 RepID=A0A3A1UUA8_9BACL|nr:copper amine oxidase N-terminal domain-containing protein [Paenibacillus nanensis]RIX52119.1 copper amine oxidase N-terminal domain-containing protein [Paenibacillus nanensis]
MRNKIGKTLLSTLTVTALSVSSATVIFASNEGTPQNVVPIKAGVDQEQVKPSSHYLSVTGTIKEISKHGQNEEMQLVTVTNAAGDITNFIVSDDTYLLDELAVGSEIVAFYDANLPVIMIYPPQYKAVAVALAGNSRNVKVDYFDESLTSADGTLKLNPSDGTKIILEDGTAFTGDITGRDLFVSYGPSTRSIPAQTTPELVVVLSDEEEAVQDQEESFASLTGTVKDITELTSDNAASKQLLAVEIKDGELVHLIVSNNTYIDEELAAGAEIVAFYNANAPMTMIYPPRYDVEAIALVKDDRSVMVDRFDETLLNAGQTLKLNISEETIVTAQDGEAFEGDLTNRKLFVEYQAVALSLPGQTTPTRIVVLDEQPAVNPEEPLTISVNDQLLEASSAYMNEHGTVMIPLRAVAEALGYELTWEADTKTVRVGQVISLQIGNDDYIYAKMAPIQLDAAPALVDGLTYVPVSFFKEVARAKEVSIDSNQIVIRG